MITRSFLCKCHTMPRHAVTLLCYYVFKMGYYVFKITMFISRKSILTKMTMTTLTTTSQREKYVGCQIRIIRIIRSR